MQQSVKVRITWDSVYMIIMAASSQLSLTCESILVTQECLISDQSCLLHVFVHCIKCCSCVLCFEMKPDFCLRFTRSSPSSSVYEGTGVGVERSPGSPHTSVLMYTPCVCECVSWTTAVFLWGERVLQLETGHTWTCLIFNRNVMYIVIGRLSWTLSKCWCL